MKLAISPARGGGQVLEISAEQTSEDTELRGLVMFSRPGDRWKAMTEIEELGGPERGFSFRVPRFGDAFLLRTTDEATFHQVHLVVYDNREWVVHSLESDPPVIRLAAGYCGQCHAPMFSGYNHKWPFCATCQLKCRHSYTIRKPGDDSGQSAIWRCDRCGHIDPSGILEQAYQQRLGTLRKQGFLFPNS